MGLTFNAMLQDTQAVSSLKLMHLLYGVADNSLLHSGLGW